CARLPRPMYSWSDGFDYW
nr:immunoglobulin heavy chain junction region [Macaca mulatta]MOV89285.1 immunoglobulin heavy chain junction region [Macaca mulatta]MOV90286.1 immunoglobulin heavy chain junction region [Macaca mulatta]